MIAVSENQLIGVGGGGVFFLGARGDGAFFDGF